MNSAYTTNWLNTRTIQPIFIKSGATDYRRNGAVRDLIGLKASLLRVPFWTIFATVTLATSAVCGTVILNAHNQLKVASRTYEQMAIQTTSLHQDNQRLEMEVRRITSDTVVIESAARERLGMVRPTDVVVPIESRTSSSTFGTVSFVR